MVVIIKCFEIECKGAKHRNFLNLLQNKFLNDSITMPERPGINFSFDTRHKAKKSIADQPKKWFS